MVELCRVFGWTFLEYQEQPASLVDYAQGIHNYRAEYLKGLTGTRREDQELGLEL